MNASAATQPAFDLGATPRKPARKSKPKTAKANLSKPEPMDLAERLAAALPPRKDSTPEEIEARRAARRERIAMDKAEGRRDDRGRPVKHRSADVILHLVRRLDHNKRVRGASMAELQEALGWQPHTIRSYIGGVLRKRGHDIRAAVLKKGEPRRYVLPPKGCRANLRTIALRTPEPAE